MVIALGHPGIGIIEIFLMYICQGLQGLYINKDKLYPVEVVQRAGSRVKVHYIGYDDSRHLITCYSTVVFKQLELQQGVYRVINGTKLNVIPTLIFFWAPIGIIVELMNMATIVMLYWTALNFIFISDQSSLSIIHHKV